MEQSRDSRKIRCSPEDIKPNAAVLGYGAAKNSMIVEGEDVYVPPMLGKIAREKASQLEFVDYIGTHTPPLFIWHNRYDKYVPAIQPLMMAQRMQELNLPYELHIFQQREHGMSVANRLSRNHLKNESETSNVDKWVEMCVTWILEVLVKHN
ncbi:S9 family peptidase [Bacillus sp. OV166]|uniref:alpha/beta hydrolase family protein n=1 Tax=Bacillus sp. OV166 TaxID=1882763 RepID=UPI00115519A0|nr:prolyl oligopeptidase family serine peptidase [Bacillus sp. OV166]